MSQTTTTQTTTTQTTAKTKTKSALSTLAFGASSDDAAPKEKSFGTFDCVHVPEDGTTPVPGRLHVYETALSFVPVGLGLIGSASAVKMKLRDVSEADATARLRLTVTGKHDKVLSLTFTNSAPAFECLVTSWKLERDLDGGRRATGPGKRRGVAKKAKGSETFGEQLEEYKQELKTRAKSFMDEVLKLRAKPRPAPRLPTIDVEDEVSRALYVRLIKATDVIAMDSGGTSDPFASVRYRGLESTSKTEWKTLNPVWDEVFTFRVPPNKITLDETDAVELHLFDRDVALNDFIGYAKIDMTGTKVYSTKRTKVTLKLKGLPLDQRPDMFDVNHLKEKLMFWEGERQITGEVEIEYWLGNRHDKDYRVAGVPLLRHPDPLASKTLNHFCDPVSALVRVEVHRGRNIINLDDDDGSDPYVQVSLIQPDGSTESFRTHYIDDATDPQWNCTYNFIAAKPYSTELVLRVYDYDGVTSSDDLIGLVRVPIADLEMHKGVGKLPDSKWYTLLDEEGKDCNTEGTKYGDIEIRAYLDEEYFEHLHGGDTKRAVGKLSVDVLEATFMEGAPNTFVMVKTGPYWSRLPDMNAQANPQWNTRLRYPIMEPSEPVTVGVFDTYSGALLGKVRCVLSGLDDGMRYEDEFPLKTLNSSGVVVTNGTLRCAFTFKHKSPTALAARYMQPVLPEKWFIQPLSESEQRRMLRGHSAIMTRRLYNSNPSIPESVTKAMIDFSKQDVSIKSIKASIARMERVVTNLSSMGDGLSYLLSWESIPVTAFTQLIMVVVIHHPNLFMPMILLSIACASLARFPSRYRRALDRCVPDDWLSVGLAFPPDSEEEKEKKKQAEAEAKRKLEEAKRIAAEEKKRLAAEKKAAAKEAKVEAAAEAAANKKSEIFTFESLNPLASLQKQMEEITAMITDAQIVLDQAAGILERVAGILDWEEPRVTALVVVTLIGLAVVFIFIEAVARFVTRIILGVIMKTFFAIVSPKTIKWGLTFATLFALRHPAILPDAATAAIEEEKALRRAAAEAAAERAPVGSSKAATPTDAVDVKSSALDPRPIAPVNVFYRIPTQATRIL